MVRRRRQQKRRSRHWRRLSVGSVERLTGHGHGDGSKPWYLVNPKIAGKWMFIPLKMVLIGIDPYPDRSVFCCWMGTQQSNMEIYVTIKTSD
jgi:hypothetical protein